MNWQLTIDNFIGGLAPGWNLTDYPSYGNRNMAGRLANVDISNPAFITQGPGLANLTNGTQAAAVTTLIKGILDKAQASDVSFAIGGTELYKISSTAVTNDATFPRTVANMTDGQDVEYFQGKIYYSYNKASGGDVGQLTLPSTFDDDYMSTIPSGKKALQGGVPHQMIVGGNDFLYITNKNYLSSFDGALFVEQDLNLPQDSVIQSVAWHLNRLWIAANRPDLTGSNKVDGSVYIWDGNLPSWEDEITVGGKVGALKVIGGKIFIFYQDLTFTSGYKLGVLTETGVSELATFTGSLPSFYQVTEYKNLLVWVSGEEIWAYGAIDKNLPPMIFKLADGGYATVGGLACPFGTPIVASNASTNYRLAKFSGYDTACEWKSLLFDLTGFDRKSLINKIKFNFEKLATGARCDVVLRNNKGTALSSGTISFTGDGAVTTKDFFPKIDTENVRVELDWSNGSATNPVSIRNIKFEGHTIP